MGNKMKTNRGAAKRFRVSGSGKVKFKKAKMRHILTKKSTKWKRKARAAGVLGPADAKLVKRLVPYK